MKDKMEYRFVYDDSGYPYMIPNDLYYDFSVWNEIFKEQIENEHVDIKNLQKLLKVYEEKFQKYEIDDVSDWIFVKPEKSSFLTPKP